MTVTMTVMVMVMVMVMGRRCMLHAACCDEASLAGTRRVESGFRVWQLTAEPIETRLNCDWSRPTSSRGGDGMCTIAGVFGSGRALR